MLQGSRYVYTRLAVLSGAKLPGIRQRIIEQIALLCSHIQPWNAHDMRAAVNTRYGPPEVVTITQVPIPEPSDGELLVRVDATTVNRTDCAYRAARPVFMRALTGLRRPKRTVLGTEFSGQVVATGASVDRFVTGDRVFGYLEGRFGAHADYVCVHQGASVATVPAGVSQSVAAAATEGTPLALPVVAAAA